MGNATPSLRTLLEADHESLADTAAWLNSLDQAAFTRHVVAELNGDLDPHATLALRDPANLQRWHAALNILNIDLQRRLDRRNGDAHETGRWRKQTIRFQTEVLKRRAEVNGLIQRHYAAQRATRPAESPKAAAGRRATQRLIDAHRSQFLTLLAEEHAAAGLELSEAIAAELAALTTAVNDMEN